MYILLVFPLIGVALSQHCPQHCECDPAELTVTCSGEGITEPPGFLPPNYDVLIFKNTSISSIARHAFKSLDGLRELQFESCHRLLDIEKNAFKGMKKLRLLLIRDSPRLTEVKKGAFSGIGNQAGLKIRIERCPLQMVHGGAFRHCSNLRELSLSGSRLWLRKHALAHITQCDFLTLSGVGQVDAGLFVNSTRFYIINIRESNFELPARAFDDISHVHQLLIQRSVLPLIATDAFTGISTIETLELYDNKIGVLAPAAFSGAVNVGRLVMAKCSIGQMDSPESVLSQAQTLRVEHNTLQCSCRLKWMSAHPEARLADANYCGASGVFRSVRHYVQQQCSFVERAAPEAVKHASLAAVEQKKEEEKKKEEQGSPRTTPLTASSIRWRVSAYILCIIPLLL